MLRRTIIKHPVEGYFADMKNELRKCQSIMSVDRFVASHLNSIEGTSKIAKSNRLINSKKKVVNLSIDKCNFDYSNGEKSFDDVNQFEDDFCRKNGKKSGYNDNDNFENDLLGNNGEEPEYNDEHKSESNFFWLS